MNLLNIKIDENSGNAIIHTDYQSKKKLKLKVINGKSNITYDMMTDFIIPLTFNSGTYKFILYEQISRTTYTEKIHIYKKVRIKDNAYTFSSSTYIPFNENSNFYKKALELKTVENIQKYMLEHFQYNYIEAITTAKKSFSPPDIETCFQNKMGTCYTLSALLTAMLRICGISTKLVVGKADKQAHAWVEIKGKRYDIVSKIQYKKVIQYQAERYY